ncbi:MAG: ROK family protein [Corynebacterium casei]|uniref:ROK family protein n=1 Tax=Corynebacterium casei TaxID=160386 RepID=UPI003F9985B6
MPSFCTIALDIGGTKIAYGLIPDSSPTTVLASGRIPTQPADSTAQQQVQLALRTALESAAAEGLQPVRVGIGAPGVVDTATGLVTYAGPTMAGWQGTDLYALVQQATGLPGIATNDVRALGLGEYTHGGHDGFSRVLFISIGTGLGGAVIDRRTLLDSPHATAGEFSELVAADVFGYAQRAETIASGSGLTIYYNDVAAGQVPNVGEITWRDLRPTDIRLEDVAADDEHFAKILQGNLTGLGLTLGAIATAFDVDALIIGGGMAALGERVLNPLREGLTLGALAPNKSTPVIRANLGDNAPLIGAGVLATTNLD